MKILFIHPFLPYPLTSGGHQALFNGLMAVKDDVEATLVYSAVDNEAHHLAQKEFMRLMPNVILCPLLRKAPLPPTKEELIRGKIRNVYRKVFHIKDEESFSSFDTSMGWKRTITPDNREWIEHIYKVSHSRQYDIIQIEMPWRISDIYAMPKEPKKIFVHHELGFVRRELELRSIENTPYLQVCKKFVDMNEFMQLNLYDAVVSLSSIDKHKLEDNGVSVPIYPSFATVKVDKERAPYNGDGKHLVFVGPDLHEPNFIGISWFLKNCWSKLIESEPTYTLDIIGKWSPTREIEIEQSYANVKFHGYVDDLYAAIKDCIMIVPITIGSGIRMKILEACSMGIPFVSTTVGAEGIPVKNGVHCFLADAPDAFVKGIITLQDQSIASMFCKNSYELVFNHFSTEALRKNRKEIYTNVLSANG